MLQAEIAGSDVPTPAVSVVMCLQCPDGRHLRQALASVRQQTIDGWSLVVVAVGHVPGVETVRDLVVRDRRIVLLQVPASTPIPAALNAAMDRVEAPYVAVLDQHDFLEPDALGAALRAARATPEAEIIYTDLELVNERDVATQVFSKPDWSPERLLGHAYVSHLAVFRDDAIRRVGGFGPAFEGAHDHDLELRIAEGGAPVVHVPRRLYNRRMQCVWDHSIPDAAKRGRQAIQDHLDRVGASGLVRPASAAGYFSIERHPRPGSFASIIIPTRGGRWTQMSRPVKGTGGPRSSPVMAVTAVASIIAQEYITDYEVVVVHDSEADPSYLDQLLSLAGARIKVVQVSGPFNFSRKINAGVEASSGDVIVLLNDDVEVVTMRWLDQLVALAQLDDVGAVGAKLLYEDGTIQHAGLCYQGGLVRHIAAGEEDEPGPFGQNLVDREVIGVTAACLAQRRVVWDQVGGLDEALPINFNDVDFCARVRAKDYRIIQANSVVLHHFESKTRRAGAHGWEVRRIFNRLGDDLSKDDPYTRHSGPFADDSDTRSLREWVRVTREVLATEGVNSFARKAGRRVAGGRVAAPDPTRSVH